MPEHLSGSVRFSVESLLYYAPKITGTGQTLADAVTGVQRRLIDLGNFCGGSWPDKPFASSYPRAQYAMLICSMQIASEIQGIGGGIEQMARTYGIAEEQNSADVSKIEANEGRTASLIYHTGGLPQPPDVPLNAPVSLPPAALPTPQPNIAPSAPAAARLDSYISVDPSPHVTPSPKANVDPTTWHPSGLNLEGPWPSGDPVRMEDAADCWTTLLNALDTAWSDLQRYTAYIMADAQGAAADAFNDYVDGLTATGHGSLTRAIQACQDLHDVCLHQAEETRVLRSTLEQIALELVITFVINQTLSALMFETTQGLGDAIDAGIAARLTSLAENFATVAKMLGSKLDTAIEAVSKAVSAGLVAGAESGTLGAFDLAANNAITMAFGEQPTVGTAALKSMAENFAVGFFLGQGSAGGVLGVSAAAASKKLINLGEAMQDGGGDSGTAAALVQLGVRLKDGGITVSAAHAALTQLVTQHELTPVTFYSSTISNRFTTMISPHPGSHARG